MQSIRVMVTGAGSMVGQGIIKSLQHSSLNTTIIAADISPYHAGLYRADEAVLIPRVEAVNAFDDFVSIIKNNEINIVMIGSEYDLLFFSKNKQALEKETNATIIVSEFETVQMANDKWLTVQFLKENNLPYPESYLVENLEQALQIAEKLTYPFILKSRQGTSARNVFVIHNQHELMCYFPMISLPLLQKMISPPKDELDNEYTCSIFKTKDNQIIGPFNSRRVLKNGSSWLTEVKPFEFLNPILMKIADKLNFMGTINVQLMNSEHGPIPFEINARSSGTTAVRTYHGFNEPEMTIMSYFLGKKIENPKITSGYCLRYVEELFLPEDFLEKSKNLDIKAERMDWF